MAFEASFLLALGLLVLGTGSAIQRLAKDLPAHAAVVDLAGVHHNLLRARAGSQPSGDSAVSEAQYETIRVADHGPV